MVGLWFLVPTIGVRIPIPEPNKKKLNINLI